MLGIFGICLGCCGSLSDLTVSTDVGWSLNVLDVHVQLSCPAKWSMLLDLTVWGCLRMFEDVWGVGYGWSCGSFFHCARRWSYWAKCSLAASASPSKFRSLTAGLLLSEGSWKEPRISMKPGLAPLTLGLVMGTVETRVREAWAGWMPGRLAIWLKSIPSRWSFKILRRWMFVEVKWPWFWAKLHNAM